MMLSVIIPSRESSYLQKTVDDLIANAIDPIEVVVVLDGYWPENFDWKTKGIKVIHQDAFGMRAAINTGVAYSTGKFIMKVDEHCKFDHGYDRRLFSAGGDKSVVIPRRYRLEPDTWTVIEDGRPPIDYMYLQNKNGYMHGTEWKKKSEVMIDYTMSFQGSCWYMPRSFWDSIIGPLDDINYGQFANEAQEIGNKAWLGGGEVIVNKNTWYAHWHRDRRGYGFSSLQKKEFSDSIEAGRRFCFDFWVNNRWDKRVRDFSWLVERFSPLPEDAGWSSVMEISQVP